MGWARQKTAAKSATAVGPSRIGATQGATDGLVWTARERHMVWTGRPSVVKGLDSANPEPRFRLAISLPTSPKYIITQHLSNPQRASGLQEVGIFPIRNSTSWYFEAVDLLDQQWDDATSIIFADTAK